MVRYTATASVGGKLGQIGARMLDAASKQMADQFFKRLGQELGDGQTRDSATPLEPTAPAHVTGTHTSHTPHPHHSVPAGASLTEGTRLLWFACGCAATGFGVVLASWLR